MKKLSGKCPHGEPGGIGCQECEKMNLREEYEKKFKISWSRYLFDYVEYVESEFEKLQEENKILEENVDDARHLQFKAEEENESLQASLSNQRKHMKKLCGNCKHYIAIHPHYGHCSIFARKARTDTCKRFSEAEEPEPLTEEDGARYRENWKVSE